MSNRRPSPKRRSARIQTTPRNFPIPSARQSISSRACSTRKSFPPLLTAKALAFTSITPKTPWPPGELFSFRHLDLSLAPLETVCASPLICEICGICGFKFGIYLYAPCRLFRNSSPMLAAFAWQIPRSVTGIMRESVRARIYGVDFHFTSLRPLWLRRLCNLHRRTLHDGVGWIENYGVLRCQTRQHFDATPVVVADGDWH